MRCRVLVVDDDAALQYAFRELLTLEGYEVHTTGDPFDGLKILPEYQPHIVLLDLSMPKMNGLEMLAQIKKRSPQIVVIVITAYGTQEIAVRAIKSGADDYFSKPFSNEAMLLTLKNARERLHLEQENRDLREEMGARIAPGIRSLSPRMADVARTIDQVAETDVTVLIRGESGTGKEVVANTLYQKSRRRGKPFVKLNCAALPESLIESELFGYEPGAFTGASSIKKGRFELANGGTIFLDEIGDMTFSTQTKVLRVLQEREVERLGASTVLAVDVRVLCATNQNLEAKIQSGQFREDLYYRLNVVKIVVPPLRERPEDIPLLAQHFLDLYADRFDKPRCTISTAMAAKLASYPWPGNVRELENGVARGVVLDDLDSIVPRQDPGALNVPPPTAESPQDAGPQTGAAASSTLDDQEVQSLLDMGSLVALSYREAKRRVLERFERFYLLALLEKGDRNVSRAARAARMDRKNFWVKLKPYLRGREQNVILPGDDKEDES